MPSETAQFRDGSGNPLDVKPRNLIIAGWSGRDRQAVEDHIAELEVIGVQRPSQTPLFYRVAADLLTTQPVIQVVGNDSSGEVEPVLIHAGGKIYVGVASDHTDRTLESHSVALAKQVCAKPVSATLWRFAEVKPHWDELQLRCWTGDADGETLYQEGAVSQLIDPSTLMATYKGDADGTLSSGEAMLCGTLPTHGGLKTAREYRLQLHDPVLKRRIELRYAVETLPVIS